MDNSNGEENSSEELYAKPHIKRIFVCYELEGEIKNKRDNKVKAKVSHVLNNKGEKKRWTFK